MMSSGRTMTLTVEVDERDYPGALEAVAGYLRSREAAGVEAAKDGVQRVRESGLDKRVWAGPSAVEDAVGTLVSTTTVAWPIIKAFVDDYARSGEPVTYSSDGLADDAGLTESQLRVYRRLLGKQAWRNGERMNPVTSGRLHDGSLRYYMRPEALAAFEKAFETVYAKLVQDERAAG